MCDVQKRLESSVIDVERMLQDFAEVASAADNATIRQCLKTASENLNRIASVVHESTGDRTHALKLALNQLGQALMFASFDFARATENA